MIKYIIEKGVNLKCKNEEGWRPMYIICRYSTLEMIIYVIGNMIKKYKKINLLSLEELPKILKYNNNLLKMNILKIIYHNTNLTNKEKK
jgi:hypothetical protein